MSLGRQDATVSLASDPPVLQKTWFRSPGASAASPAKLYRQGFITSSANPFTVMFFAAPFPWFLGPDELGECSQARVGTGSGLPGLARIWLRAGSIESAGEEPAELGIGHLLLRIVEGAVLADLRRRAADESEGGTGE